MNAHKTLSKNDMLVKVAKMYYKQSMTQQQIADELFLSRSNVSRLLKNCVDKGIVEFYINETTSHGQDLQLALNSKFGLKDSIVIASSDNLETSKEQLASRLFMYLQPRIKENMTLGVAWGTTLHHVSLAFRPIPDVDVSVVQLVGGQGSVSLDTDGSEIAKRLAKCLGGNAYIPYVPFLVGNPKLKDMLMCDQIVEEHFSRARNVDIALVGVGSSAQNLNSAKRAGYISAHQIEELVVAGAVADVCGIQLNKDGLMCSHDFESRRIGLSFEDIQKIPYVLAACVGTDKATAIHSALKSGLIDVIAIDENTATEVLNMAN